MAEFQEIVKQAKRMCRMYENSCTGCPIADQDDRCMFEVGNADCIPESWDLRKLRIAEELVMAWAAAHPEPRYPSWNDAWHQLFPDMAEKFPPCYRYFMGSARLEGFCPGLRCEKCRNQPVFADIAEKLGIKPIGSAGHE